MSATWSRAWWAPVAALVPLLVVYPWSSSLWGTVIYLSIAVACAGLVLRGVRRHRPASVGPWWLIIAALGCYVLGDISWTVLVASDREPFPSVADAFYLAFYPLLFLGLAGFVRRRQHVDRAAWVDSVLWTVGVAVISWESLLEPNLLVAAQDIATLVALAYPMMDLALLLIALRIIADRSGRTPAVLLMMIALATQLLADVGFLIGASGVGEVLVPAELLDLGWLITYLGLAAAALHPSMVSLTEKAEPGPVLASRWRLALLAVPALTVPGSLVYVLFAGHLRGETDDAVMIAVATAAVIVLIVARSSGLLAVANRRTDEAEMRRVELERALAERERAAADLLYRVDHDALTDLRSKAAFVVNLDDALRSMSQSTEPVSVAFLDLDDFKTVNDSLGHDAGDKLLVCLADRLRTVVADDGMVARFGGDEFAVLTRAEDVDAITARMHDALTDRVLVDGRQLRSAGSIGVVTATREGQFAVTDMLQAADVAMYEAKRSGVPSVTYRPGMGARTQERLDMRERLTEAMATGELQPWFQPVVSLRGNHLIGFEALARWCKPGEEAILPGIWLPFAEETGLIAEIDRAIVESAIVEFQRWRCQTGAVDVHLAVNMSGRTLGQADIERQLLTLLRTHGLPPSTLILEITEGALLDDPHVSERLQILRAAGVRIALDDFGTGWSSLDYLRRFPVDQLKLDHKFTAELGCTADAGAIPSAVAHLADALSLETVAEGIETPTQAAELLAMGFDAAQGFLFSRPLPASRLVHYWQTAACSGSTAVHVAPSDTATVSVPRQLMPRPG